MCCFHHARKPTTYNHIYQPNESSGLCELYIVIALRTFLAFIPQYGPEYMYTCNFTTYRYGQKPPSRCFTRQDLAGVGSLLWPVTTSFIKNHSGKLFYNTLSLLSLSLSLDSSLALSLSLDSSLSIFLVFGLIIGIHLVFGLIIGIVFGLIIGIILVLHSPLALSLSLHSSLVLSLSLDSSLALSLSFD